MLHIIHFTQTINDETVVRLQNTCLDAVTNGRPTEIQLRISSPGGSLEAGFTLYQVLKNLPVPVHTHNTGLVRSIALPIFLAGVTRSADPNSRFVLHPCSWTLNGEIPYPVLKEIMTRLEDSMERYTAIVTEATQTHFDPRPALTNYGELVLNPTEALAAGLI